MDSTTYTSCQIQFKKQSKYYQQESDDQFHSFNDGQLGEQVANELANFKDQIRPNLYGAIEQEHEENQFEQIKKVKHKLKVQRDNQQFIQRIVKGSQDKNRRVQSESCTYYASLQKRSSSQSLEFKYQKFKNSSPLSPNSQNRVSLLQGSLQLQKNLIESQSKEQVSYKNILNLKSEKSSKQQKPEQEQTFNKFVGKAFPSSPQKTNISDKFNLPYNFVVEGEQKSNSKWSDKNNEISMEKKVKKYRIQKPDQVYTQLELEIEKQKEKDKQKGNRIKQKDKQPKISSIVRENINNTIAMLDKNTQNKHTLNQNILPIPKIHQQPTNIPLISLSTHNNPAKFPVITSTCLFRLPSPSLYNTLKQFYTNQYYHKYCFELSEEQLIIDNSYHIRYQDITKIKMIYNQFNRPQVKITYHAFKYYEVDPEQKRRREANVKNQIQSKQIENNNSKKGTDGKAKVRQSFCVAEEEMKKNVDDMVVYLCECYESVYTIFSCVIMRKMITLARNRFKKKQVKNEYPSNPYNLTSLIVNTNLINSKKNGNDPTHISFDYKIKGIIFKRSRHLKKWDRRFAQIENFIFRSYRLENISQKQKKQREKSKQRSSVQITESISSSSIQQSKTMSSQATHNIQYSTSNIFISEDYKASPQCTFEIQSIKQLWTRFDTVDGQYIVMKLFQKNKIQKIQLGIPITNFCDVIDKSNWMLGLVSVLKGEA